MKSDLNSLLKASNASDTNSGLCRDFILMNKDNELAKFTVIEEDGFEAIIIKEELIDLPIWLQPLDGFIRGRKAPKSRENIERLLEESGCNTLLGYLNITHALSLIDTFWVKQKDSKLTWRDVSLYDKQFNEVIAKTAFEGGLHGGQLSTTSPEYGTDGTFAKCWVREYDQIKLLKKGTTGFLNAGLEPYSEYYASQLAKELGLNHIEYTLRNYNGKLCSSCNIFTSEDQGYLPYAAVERINSTLDSVIFMYSKYGYRDFALDMFVFDALIYNCDRHKGNFGFLVDNDTQKIIKPAPLFDHNLSLICYALEDDFDKEEYIEQLKPRIGSSFIKDAKRCLTSNMRRKLINIKGFKFQKHPKYNLPDWRLEILEKLINNQIDLILQK